MRNADPQGDIYIVSHLRRSANGSRSPGDTCIVLTVQVLIPNDSTLFVEKKTNNHSVISVLHSKYLYSADKVKCCFFFLKSVSLPPLSFPLSHNYHKHRILYISDIGILYLAE